ncbi:hypothetical protein [Streptomyces nanshensis]|uniref:Uncharacterized protein n=1 Tax=Streptomyces nanshensis TaxID=518642 RepID=A0A1E7KZF0_9ACTN|nr:hypothetical protein [Streptomyces nanshensis]OEV09327.1 hypothetical protein AN218_23145 [Streptomyces nanshensis]
MKPTTASDLFPGDRIAFRTDSGPDYRLIHSESCAQVPGLLRLTFDGIGDVAMPAESPVTGVYLPRQFTLPCLLCGGGFAYECDLATLEGTPRAGICGPCNDRTTLAVLAQL